MAQPPTSPMAQPSEQPSPVSARVSVPDQMRYTGSLPIQPTAPPGTSLSDNVWRNIAITLAVVLVGVSVGVYIFWPKSGGSDQASALTPYDVFTSATAGTPISGAPSSAAATQPQAGPPSGTAMPVGDLPGWRQTFTDDFNSADLEKNWGLYDGQPGGDPGGWFLRSHVKQSGGKLIITGSRERTPNGNVYATGGISNAKVFSQTYGKFELRFRMDRGYGINFVLLLWPTNDQWPPEINIAEDDGKSRDLITATLHYGADNSTISRKSKGAADFTKWHTVGVEWKPGSLVFKLDGKTWSTMSSPNVPNIPMSMAIQSQAWPCGGSFSDCPNSTTPPVVNLEVDWAVAYTPV